MPRGLLIAAGALAGGAVIAAVASLAVAVAVVRGVIVPPVNREQDTDVVGVDQSARTITFSRTPEAVTDGRLSFWFDSARGHARIGRIVSETRDTVTRELLRVDFGDIDSTRRGRFNGWFYLYPSDVGVDYENVVVETELGPAPAWLVRSDTAQVNGAEDRWVIHVHGRAVMRAETIRAIPVFRDAGYTSLLISYRNDFEAPSSDDGRYSLGDTEWRDVESALAFAIEHGATSVILMGWSMGGATVLQAATRSPLATVVDGVVLDSPVIDWVDAIGHQARSRGAVKPFRAIAYAMIGSGWGKPFTGLNTPVDLHRLDFVRRSADLVVPTLILHSDDDDYVPSGPSRALAAARPDIVTLEAFHTARHTRLWNYDPERWNRAITQWLAELPSRYEPSTARTARSRSPQEAE